MISRLSVFFHKGLFDTSLKASRWAAAESRAKKSPITRRVFAVKCDRQTEKETAETEERGRKIRSRERTHDKRRVNNFLYKMEKLSDFGARLKSFISSG